MHPKVEQAIREIDAAVFGADTFEEPEARLVLLKAMEAWTIELAGRDLERAKEEGHEVGVPGEQVRTRVDGGTSDSSHKG